TRTTSPSRSSRAVSRSSSSDTRSTSRRAGAPAPPPPGFGAAAPAPPRGGPAPRGGGGHAGAGGARRGRAGGGGGGPRRSVQGGSEGGPNYLEYETGSVHVRRGRIARLELADGALVSSVSGSGGGFGDPLERDPGRVREDVLDGYVTVEQARREYGVALDPV